MLIILEGPDGAGKTSLAVRLFDELHNRAPARVLHRGPMRGDFIEEYEQDLENYWPGRGEHVICDRWHIGELVYGPILRGKSQIARSHVRHIDKFLLRRGAVMVGVGAPTRILEQRLADRGDDLVTPDMIPRIVEGYHDVFTYSTMQTMQFEVTTDEIDWILTHGAVAERVAYRLDEFNTYVGPPDATVLLLGEARKRNKDDTLKWPDRSAFVPRPGTSGDFLLQNLPSDIAMSCGLANALEEDIDLLWQRLGMPLVVALGQKAKQRCIEAEIPAGVVPHPQYVRRFHHHRGHDYGSAVREAALYQEDMTHAFSA